MDRHRRAFQPAALPLEGRILLATASVQIVPVSATVRATPTVTVSPIGHSSTTASGGTVSFLGNPSAAGTMEQVVQQGNEAVVWLQGYTGDGPLQVQVATDPSSPAVGVNLPAVNQTVTIPGSGMSVGNRGQNDAFVTIPTNAGAPNSGEVDVNLTITPIDPPSGVTVQGGPLVLKIMAPNAATPPMIIGATGTPNGIQLSFSKPMNPAQASNVHNYAVRAFYTTTSGKDDFLSSSPLQYLSPFATLGGTKTRTTTKSVILRSASYDPADSTVTLIPKRKLNYTGGVSIIVTPGSPAKTSAAVRNGSSPAQGLTDLEGNAINQGGNSGKFYISVHPGYTPFGVAQVQLTTSVGQSGAGALTSRT
jgi:hypothetical protein